MPSPADHAALLDLLARDLPAEAMQTALASDERFKPYRADVQTMEPRMLAVAAELVKKWGAGGNPALLNRLRAKKLF